MRNLENKDGKSAEEIKIVFDEPSTDKETVTVPDKKDSGKLEFYFKEEKRIGLVFEEDTDGQVYAEADNENEVQGNEELTVAPETPAIEPDITELAESVYTEHPSEYSSEQLKEEFAIPDVFDLAAEEERVFSEESTRIWSTYVPRFTDVSETYRMNDDPRPRPEKREKIVTLEDKEPKKDENAPDPTEELYESSVTDAVVVNLNEKTEEEQGFSIYKFSNSETATAPATRERTVEDERKEIEMLVGRKRESAPTEEPIQTQEAEPVGQAPKPKKKSYKLPDPEVDREVHVVDYPTVAKSARNMLAEAPEGADDGTAHVNKKGRITEYTANMQREAFKDKFLDLIMSAKIRLVAAAVIAFAMLLFENIGLFNVDLARLLRIDSIPGAVAIADFQFVACIFVLALPEVVMAVKHLIKGIILPELLLVFSLLIMFIYTFIIVLVAPMTEYPLFGALFAVQGLVTIIATSLKRNADFIAFKRISKPGEKKILDRKLTRALERENLALDGAVDEYKSKTARIFKTTFISDFFKRAAIVSENSVNVILAAGGATVLATVGGVVAFFVGNGWLSFAAVFCAIAMFTVPAVSILTHKLPFYHTTLECELEESAMIGENTVYDYAGVDVVAFEDTDIFGVDDVNLKRIIHYGNVDNMMKAMRQMSAIFANAGGPLSIIFSNSLDRKCPPATAPQIELDGLSGKVDGHLVCAGTAEYMKRHDIALPNDSSASRVGIADSTKIMYGAEDGAVYVQFHIRYSFSEEFTMTLPTLKAEKIVPLVYTRDPNITAELMRTLTSGEDLIRVLKKSTAKLGEDKIYRRISTGVVTSGDKINAINVILLAKRYVKLQNKLSIGELIAAGAGAVLSIALAIAGALGVSSLLFFGWQAIWCLALYIISRRSFAVSKKATELQTAEF